MYEGGALVASCIYRGPKILRCGPASIGHMVGHIYIIASVAAGAVAGEVQVPLVRGQARSRFKKFAVYRSTQIFGGTPPVRRAVGDIQVAATQTSGKIASDKDE